MNWKKILYMLAAVVIGCCACEEKKAPDAPGLKFRCDFEAGTNYADVNCEVLSNVTVDEMNLLLYTSQSGMGERTIKLNSKADKLFSGRITGLKSNSDYWYRLQFANALGTEESAVEYAFRTKGSGGSGNGGGSGGDSGNGEDSDHGEADKPGSGEGESTDGMRVVTLGYKLPDDNSAICYGRAENCTKYELGTIGFFVGETREAVEAEEQMKLSWGAEVDFEVTMKRLQRDREYYYQAFVTRLDNNKKLKGEIKSFRTK